MVKKQVGIYRERRRSRNDAPILLPVPLCYPYSEPHWNIGSLYDISCSLYQRLHVQPLVTLLPSDMPFNHALNCTHLHSLSPSLSPSIALLRSCLAPCPMDWNGHVSYSLAFMDVFMVSRLVFYIPCCIIPRELSLLHYIDS